MLFKLEQFDETFYFNSQAVLSPPPTPQPGQIANPASKKQNKRLTRLEHFILHFFSMHVTLGYIYIILNLAEMKPYFLPEIFIVTSNFN